MKKTPNPAQHRLRSDKPTPTARRFAPLLILAALLAANACSKGNPPGENGTAKGVNLHPGAVFEKEYRLHASVGYGAEYEIANEAVLRLKTVKKRYHHPERMAPGMTGGDAATGIFVFEAIAPGTTVLRIRHTFRGTVEREETIPVTVAEAR